MTIRELLQKEWPKGKDTEVETYKIFAPTSLDNEAEVIIEVEYRFGKKTFFVPLAEEIKLTFEE